LTRSILRWLPLIFLLCLARPLAAQSYRVDTLARAPFAQYPVSLAFVPGGNGTFFFTEKNSGRVRVFDKTLRPEPFVTVSVDNEGEQGLLGIAIHPQYPDTPFVFIYYIRASDRLGIVERYTDSLGVGIHPAQILVIPRMTDATENNGGVIAFGPDGTLYVGVGDHRTQSAFVQDTSQRRSVWGKILRINTDGSIPADNPSPLRPFWAWGLRNPRGLAFDQQTGVLYCTEGGTDAANAIYRIQKGDNLGWPLPDRREPPATVRPLLTFPEGRQPALTGIGVYRGGAFPRLRGSILFTANALPNVWVGRLSPGGDSLSTERLFTYPSGFADLQIAPDGTVYLTNGPYLSSKILRISPVAPSFASRPPSEAAQDTLYTYAPVFSGTPPEVRLLAGPGGMTWDPGTGQVQWTPTNTQALQQQHTYVLEARNGAGTALQTHTVAVTNVNDPPEAFQLGLAPGIEVLSFSGEDPELTLHWETSVDPDGDTVQYVVEIDTLAEFTSPALRTFVAEQADSIHIVLPRTSQTYFWRVIANDGRLSTTAEPSPGKIAVAYVPPPSPKAEQPAPATESLAQNYPNPFNPSTSISYTVQQAGYVRLSVFNLLGQEIARVYEGNQDAGTYEVSFRNLDIPSGIYFYRLQAPGIFETKKMIIAR
jgi:glucose/arabinose dehydrogenase